MLYLYRHVLEQPLETVGPVRARKPQRLPVVLTKAEALRVIGAMSGVNQLMARLFYGSGLRLMECLRLRVKDIDFEQRTLTMRDGKGEKDRLTMLPESVIAPLRDHLVRVHHLHTGDLKAGFGAVYLPDAWSANTPTPPANGSGSTSSRPTPSPPTRAPALPAAITWTKAACSGPCAGPRSSSASINPSAVTPSATPLPLTCSKPAMTFAPCKNCWVIRT